MLAQILAYMANADNEQRSTECGSCELSRLGSSKAAERLGLQICASSDENIQGKSTTVLAQGVDFAWIFEEHRDSDRAKLWNMSYERE